MTSFSDMLSRVPYYASVLRVLRVLCRPALAQQLTMQLPPGSDGEGASVASVVAQLAGPANQYIKVGSRGTV